MECEKISEKISAYFDNDIDRESYEKLKEHTDKCEKCKTDFKQMGAMLENLREIPLEPLPTGYHESLMAKLSEQKPKRFANKFAYRATAAAFLACAVALGGLSQLNRTNNSTQLARNFSASDAAPAESFENEAVAEETDAEYSVTETAPAPLPTERKLIKNYYAEILAEDFDAAINEIKNKTARLGGYVENYFCGADYDANGAKYGEITVRIPQEKYAEIIGGLSSVGKILNENENSEDVTADYVDTQARLSVKKTEREKITSLLEKSQSLDDIIKLEERLSQITADIEAYESKIKNWDRLVDYCSVSINIRQNANNKIQPANADFTSKLKNGFIGSINGLTTFLQNAVLFVVSAWAQITLIAAAFCAIIVFVRRKIRNKSKY